MLLRSLQSFCERHEIYQDKFSSFIKHTKLSEENEIEILELLCSFLMDPKYTKDVAECFPQLLLILLTMSIKNNENSRTKLHDADLVHRLNCTIIGKLILIHPDVLNFALQYFETNPSPFESPNTETDESINSKKQKTSQSLVEVSDYEIVEACYNILKASPDNFKYKWNWSKFYKYLRSKDDGVKWLAVKCVGIVLEMSEVLQSSCARSLIDDVDKFITEVKKDDVNIILQLKNFSKETERLAKTVSSVVSVAGVLLPVFDSKIKNVKTDLISVPSMEENLRSLALAVASRKCICLQGAVGCGKTAIVEYLATITGHGATDFIKVQLGDQTDSKMLLGTYRCTDIPGEFIWQPGVLTQAVTAGKWLLLEDIDSAALDVASVLSNLLETGTLSVPGYRDIIHVKSGFQLFVTQRLIHTMSGLHRQTSGATSLLEKHWLCVNITPLSKEELIIVVQTLFPVLNTVATKMVDVFLLFSVGNHEINSNEDSEDDGAILKTGRLISTRDLIKWCSRASLDFVVSSPESALKLFQDAIDIFCCSVPNEDQRLTLAVAIGNKLGIIKTKAEYFARTHKPSITVSAEYFVGGRSKLKRKKSEIMQIEKISIKFSFTRPSACLLERITSCVAQNEPVLLVGETGTGKTSSVQYLARSTGQKLIVINMNQQSESADLLGGYKPVDLKFLIFPIREEFEMLFRSFFAVEPNKKFLHHVGMCYEKNRWKTLVGLMSTSTNAALKRLRTQIASLNGESTDEKIINNRITLDKWEKLSVKLDKLTSQVKAQFSIAFAFIEGSLIKALKEGYWVLLDEINLANAETLECLSGLLEGSSGSLSLLERGDKESIKRHPDFTIFACMNPATDVGKKELPVGLRNRFTEFYVDELTERSDLQLLVGSYLEELNLPVAKQEAIVKFYLNVRKEAMWSLFDGTAHKPHYSLRTLCRALSVAATNPCNVVLRSLYEAFCLSFLTQLDNKSYPIVLKMIVEAILDKKTAKSVINSAIPKPRCSPSEDYIEFEGYWVIKGSIEPETPKNYILTQSVRRNLKDVVRVVSIGKMPLLLQGDTSVGKTSLITYLAKASGHVCVRINNHEHTDLQEYVGSYVADDTGKLVFKEGVLVEAMRKGYWIILDELNLAPSDVLEALNRVLDDNRELFIPETQETVKAHENFMLFATQNPPGLYGGRKVLSRAFRNRFVELHFDEIPANELETILHERCSMPRSYCKQIISVMTDLQIRRKNTAAFAGKQGFITLRDLFRWGERYRLAPDMGNQLYDWSQHLADEGYLVLAAKVRKSEEANEIRQVIKKHLKRDVDPENLFTLSDKTSSVTKSILEVIKQQNDSAFGHIVWTYHMRRMAVLIRKSYQFKEPVLLVGETGGGKTTICQLIAHVCGKKLYMVNCHMHTESSDFLGNLRPVRTHDDDENQKLFEWVDGPLIKSMQYGDFFLADEISLADDSVLERLNSLLEPERSLLLAEKGIGIGNDLEDANNTIVASDDFFFIGTMNPGGDYGKKELSPALRNRFTEIWCDGCTERKDLMAIIEHNLSKEVENRKKEIAESILNFVEWLSTSDVGKRFTVSIRDILSWVNFINVCLEHNQKFKLSLPDAYYHGACLTYIDSLGSGLTSMESIEKLKVFKESTFSLLRNQTTSLKPQSSQDSMEIDLEIPKPTENVFGIAPFFISKGLDPCSRDSVTFTFHAPTTKENCLKLLRALQLRKPLLLEGSPGVGKTSLVSALAKVSGHTCLRINLSDQTDISDLFGADLPVEGGKGGEFAWKDGPFLRALKAGHWILLDELNLASQSVLEGLNACFDHRGEIYIPELGRTFTVKPETKLFACQNPLRQGGARRGLPKSFLNRFTQVFVDALTDDDLQFIVASQFPDIQEEVISKMIKFNSKLAKEAGVNWGFSGAPWEMNLRDVTRWCEATIAAAERDADGNGICNPGCCVELIYVDRMRTKDDKAKVIEMYKQTFSEKAYPILTSPLMHVTTDNVYFGDVALQRTNTSVYNDQNFLILRDQIKTLRSLAQCVKMNWMSILVGGSGCGKSSVVRVLAQITGQKLKSLVVNSAMDTTEILGGFEQTDYNRHLEQLVEKTEILLTHCLKTKVNKENINQIEKYQALIEKVRELSEGECESVTMIEATELFLNKIGRLEKLLKEMINLEKIAETELDKIKVNLEKLKDFVEQDKCLNAGGKFEWVDSILVKCLEEGTWLLIDQVNLCSPAVLDRLNGLLEPNGVLSIGERGVDNDGNVVTVKPHKNFRLFLTMDPKYGEISRAMRNRGVEIFMLNYNENLDSGRLDFRSLLYTSGLSKRNHQEALMAVHKRMSEDASNVDSLNVIQLLHSAFLITQQLSRGFPVSQAFKTSCTDVYLKARSIFHRETRMRLSSILDDTIREFEVDESDDYVLDLEAATCSVRNLQDNSKLTLVKQQGLLMDWCTKGYFWVAKNSAEIGSRISLKTDFINEFFTSVIDQPQILSIEICDILPYVLLNFYERSCISDVELRKIWVSNIFQQNPDFRVLDIKNSLMSQDLLSSNIIDCDQKFPWDRKYFKNANNLALLLFYDGIVVNPEIENTWKLDNSEKAITIAQFSKAHLDGKMTIKLKDNPLITNYVTFLLQVKKYFDHLLKNSKALIDDTKYVILRQNLKWFSRFCLLGNTELLNKTNQSKNMFENLDEIVLLMKVHYKWLTKFLRYVDENLKIDNPDTNYMEDRNILRNIMDEINNSLMSIYDPFRKICKAFKKYIKSPLPYSSEITLNTCSVLQNVTDSFSPFKNKYVSCNLETESKFITLQSEEAVQIRSQLISLWQSIYDNESLDEDIFSILENVKKYCQTHLNINEINEDNTSEKLKNLTLKEMDQISTKIQLWPIHEYMFLIFVKMFQRKLCEQLIQDEGNIVLPSTYLSTQHVNIPNIPIELLAILNAIYTKQHNPEERNRLRFALFNWFLRFNENSYAIKHFKQVSHWKFVNTENKNNFDNVSEILDYENLANGPILVRLVSELLLNKLQHTRTEKSLVTGVNLGSFNTRLQQLSTLNNILWKNSVALNSDRFDLESNDLQSLLCLLKEFLSICEQVDDNTYLKNSLEVQNQNPSIKSTIANEYLIPLEKLQNISDTLTTEATSLNRGKAWALLGYLQSFVYGNMGYIDPVHKVILKLKYVEENITDCEYTVYVARVCSRILGLMDDNTAHPRLPVIQARLESLNDQRSILRDLKAVRPTNTEFIALSKEFTNFRMALGSFSTINKHIERLIDTITELENEVSTNNIEAAKSAKREAEIWLESVRRFMEQIETRFLSGYPDIIYPILTGLAQMRHGIKILMDESSSCIAVAESSFGSAKLENFVCNLVRFPTIGPNQENLLSLVDLCTSHDSREMLSVNIKTENTFVALQEQFRLTITGLYELYNYIVLKGSLTKDLWTQLNTLLQQIVLIWRQQQKEIEKREAEKDSLYKNQVKVLSGSLTDEEQIVQELKNLFPTHRDDDFADVDDNFQPTLEKNVKVQSKKEDYGALITDNDMNEVQNIHSKIIKSFTTSEWLYKNATETRPDFIEPLLQRYKTFSLILDEVAPALSNELTGQLYTSLNVLTELMVRLGQGETLNPDSCLKVVKKTNKLHYKDYYKDSNVEEVKQCVPLLESILKKVTELLTEWPEHPTLISIQIILQRIYSFPVTSAVARFLTGLELLLVKMHEWEETAHSGVSLSEYTLALTQQIISWRKLELACWKDCLMTAHLKLKSRTSKWWFFLYDLFESYITEQESSGEQNSDKEPITTKKFIESLETFMSESPLVEFETRLELILTFHCHTYYLSPSIERDELLAISWNIYNYYNQFLPDINSKINSIKMPIEKKLKDFVKIARWNDINYWSVKETVEKTHRALHKFIKEFETSLQESVTPFLIVKPVYKSEAGIWDRPESEENCTIDPEHYLIPTPKDLLTNMPPTKIDIIARADDHYLTRAKKLCKEIILTSLYPGLRVGFEEFIEEFVAHSSRLRALEIDSTLPKPKQKSQAKNILQQKRMALADYFKALLGFGVSHRLGNLAWKNRIDEVLDFTIPPIELKAVFQNSFETGVIDKKTLVQWDGCERYYYGSLIKLNALNRTLLTSKTDLGAQNIEWCKGFSTHLMLMANKQKKLLASVLDYFVSLRIQVSNLSSMNNDDFITRKQKDLWTISSNLRELLIIEQACFEQFLIYLQACPNESQIEILDDSYNLKTDDLSIVNCKKGDDTWEKANSYVKECLQAVVNILKKYSSVFPEYMINKENQENDAQVFFLTSKHFEFLKQSFDSLRNVKEKIIQFATMFDAEEEGRHPLLENILFVQTNIESNLNKFDEICTDSKPRSKSISPCKMNFDKYETDLEILVNMILVVIQNKYKSNTISEFENQDENQKEDENEDQFEKNKLREKLVESIETDIKTLKLKEIYENLRSVLNTIFTADSKIVTNHCRLLQKCLPLLQQYLLLVQFYLNEQIASLRVTCKILHMQLNVFLDLATNGFCVPKDLDLEEGDGEGTETSGQGGMGLGDGEGQKDVSDKIETEDQLEDAKPAGQEKEKPEDKECPEEDKGIEMSEDFEGELQDVEKKEDEEGDEDDDNDDADKQMGDTGDGADKLDEQIWGDDDEEPEGEETNKNEEEIGDGEKTGEKEFGAKDDRTEENPEDDDDDQGKEEKEQQKEINELDEPEYDEDQVNPYHGKHQPEPEPEPLDLPEDMNVEDEDMKDDDEPKDEENPFDIDKMKEAMPPPETQETETAENEESQKDDGIKNDDSSDDEAENNKEKTGDNLDKEEDSNEAPNEEDATNKPSEAEKEIPEESENTDEKEKELQDIAMPSADDASKETDASEQIDQQVGGSKDQVADKAENEPDSKEESNAENWQEEKQDKGTGQSQAEQHDAGHSGSSMEKSQAIPNQNTETKRNEKRKNPGQSDETHTLAEHIEPEKKKLKTMIHSKEDLPDNDNDEEGVEQNEEGDPDICQHVKEKETFDHYAMDAATEEQSKEQASNLEQEQETPKEEEEPMDVEMHEDEKVEIVEDENTVKQNPEKLSDEDKSKDKKDSKEKGRVEDGQLETVVDVEGEAAETMRVERGTESNFFTNITEIENELLSSTQIEKRRIEVENTLSQWTQVPTTEEAVAAWNTLSAVTDVAARDLSEKLRLVLEPTQASRLKGDYRTGRRINMRKIIPYIASQFRKDKIWLRRTKPSKRDYQIVLAIDDSSSMADNHSKELAFESLSLISKAMTYLEAGQLSVLSFGEATNVLHPLGEPFSEQSGSRMMQEMRFEQKKTMIGQLVDFTVDMFQTQNNSSDNAKLLVVISDGRGVFSEGTEKVNRAVRRARLADIFLVFIIVDNPLNKDSILDIRMPVFKDGKLLSIDSYMDNFPFPFYLILRDINALPGVLSDALRQWFEVVGKIDS